jgi:hypothetical protein
VSVEGLRGVRKNRQLDAEGGESSRKTIAGGGFRLSLRNTATRAWSKERTRPTLLLYEARWRGIEQSPCHIGEMPDFVAGIFPEEKDFTLSSAGGTFPGSRENKKLAPLVPGRVSSTSRRSRQGEPGEEKF